MVTVTAVGAEQLHADDGLRLVSPSVCPCCPPLPCALQPRTWRGRAPQLGPSGLCQCRSGSRARWACEGAAVHVTCCCGFSQGHGALAHDSSRLLGSTAVGAKQLLEQLDANDGLNSVPMACVQGLCTCTWCVFMVSLLCTLLCTLAVCWSPSCCSARHAVHAAHCGTVYVVTFVYCGRHNCWQQSWPGQEELVCVFCHVPLSSFRHI